MSSAAWVGFTALGTVVGVPAERMLTQLERLALRGAILLNAAACLLIGTQPSRRHRTS